MYILIAIVHIGYVRSEQIFCLPLLKKKNRSLYEPSGILSDYEYRN